MTFTVHLQPDFVSAIDLPIGMPDALHIQSQYIIALGPWTPEFGVALSCRMTPVTRWGHLQYFANGLDPKAVSVTVYVRLYRLSWRSSSA